MRAFVVFCALAIAIAPAASAGEMEKPAPAKGDQVASVDPNEVPAPHPVVGTEYTVEFWRTDSNGNLIGEKRQTVRRIVQVYAGSDCPGSVCMKQEVVSSDERWFNYVVDAATLFRKELPHGTITLLKSESNLIRQLRFPLKIGDEWSKIEDRADKDKIVNGARIGNVEHDFAVVGWKTVGLPWGGTCRAVEMHRRSFRVERNFRPSLGVYWYCPDIGFVVQLDDSNDAPDHHERIVRFSRPATSPGS